MTARKHAEMIKRWADDDSLIYFTRSRKHQIWMTEVMPVWSDNFEHFLCLPQHKDACLHWLNGGDCLISFDSVKDVCGVINGQSEKKWKITGGFMNQSATVRIKPRKEKRWITYNPKTREVYNCGKGQTPANGFQIIEIEAEV